MSRRVYRIDEFFGIDQSRDENSLAAGYSPDACNMDTADGGLRVAAGYVKHIALPVPGTGQIYRMRRFCRPEGDLLVVAAGSNIYVWNGTAWQSVYQYSSAPEGHFEFLQARIGNEDNLIIASGNHQLVKYNGTAASLFGSAAGVSNIAVNYLAMYKSRLFSAGDAANPNRLYWSQLPGDTRTIENWSSVEESPNVEGGHAEVGAIGGDPIVALAALSNQLLIFKRSSLYRLIGDKPGNFVIEELDAALLPTAQSAVVKVADALFFMTPGGVYTFNGVSASPSQDARHIRTTLAEADVSASRAACAGNKLYFSIKEGESGTDALVEYDLLRRTYMLRRGFSVCDVAAWGGTLYLIGSSRYVYRWGEGDDYDGQPVSAWWRTPRTDAHDKGGVKALRELYLTGHSKSDAALLIDVYVDGEYAVHRLLLPDTGAEVTEVPLKNEGRSFLLRFYNEFGGSFSLYGGTELMFETWRRVE